MPLPCSDHPVFSAWLRASLKIVFMISSSVLAIGSIGHSQDAVPRAVEMFPADTQAYVCVPDSDAFLAHWSKTQLGQLAADERLKGFWNGQKQEIQDRFAEAGWQLNLKIDDLQSIAGGQTAIGWIARPKTTAKPFSLGIVVDVGGKVEPAKKLLSRMETELKARQSTTENIDVRGVQVLRVTLPKQAGDTRARESYYALSKDALLAADDLATITEFIDAQSGQKADSLAKTATYEKVQSQLANDGDVPELEYFVRPIGFAKLLRSVSGKPAGNQADMLKLLVNQGFESILCVAGNLQFHTDSFDIFHNGFVLTDGPINKLPTSVQILDFPNVATLTPPAFINSATAGVLSFSWNLADAFPKFAGIYDEYTSTKNGFHGLLDGFKNDTNGAQVDILNDVLPYLTTEFHLLSEIVEPITPDSKRTMIIVRLNDPDKKLGKVLERFERSEPTAKPFDYEGFRVLRISNEEEEEVQLNFDSPGSGRKATEEEEEEEQENPLLKEWAVSIISAPTQAGATTTEQFFVFASNPDMIKEVIDNIKNPKTLGKFQNSPDVKKMSETLAGVAAHGDVSFQQIDLADRSFEMQYELFRQGQLSESRSLMASILDRLLKPRNQKAGNKQKVQGNALPPFDQIKQYFTPSGTIVKTEAEGWSIQGFVLGR